MAVSVFLRCGGLWTLRRSRTSARGIEAVTWWKDSWKPRSKLLGSEPAPESVSDEQDRGGSFADMLKTSKLVRIGDPVGKEVEGEIIAVTGGNLYVDFGHKFHAVVPTPEGGREKYVKGKRVVVLLRDFELTTHFLGDGRDTSLLEAEAELIKH